MYMHMVVSFAGDASLLAAALPLFLYAFLIRVGLLLSLCWRWWEKTRWVLPFKIGFTLTHTHIAIIHITAHIFHEDCVYYMACYLGWENTPKSLCLSSCSGFFFAPKVLLLTHQWCHTKELTIASFTSEFKNSSFQSTGYVKICMWNRQ